MQLSRASIRGAMLAVASATLVSAGVLAAEPVDFAHDVLPILRQHCAKCHTDGR